MTNIKHPSVDELSAFSLGRLSQEQSQQIEAHVSSCDSCCQTMMSISSDDTFVELIQNANQAEPIAPTVMPGTTPNADCQNSSPFSHSRYEIEELIGQGGMGRVYRARHQVMDRTVALKVIHQEWIQKQEVVERFQREVKAAASLNHPNIVTAYDAEQADQLHFLVMEFVDGIDLAKAVDRNGPMSIEMASRYIAQAAEGLQHAHDQGMVHRDIKPHNLIVTDEGTVKILDFGLASLVTQAATGESTDNVGDGTLTMAGSIMGTPDYISPEQSYDASCVDGRSDIYSLGMTLYFLLAGHAPFMEGSATEKIVQHSEHEPKSLSRIRNDVPRELLDVVARMIAKNPENRFQSPRDVADALAQFAQDDNVNNVNPSDLLTDKNGDSGNFLVRVVAGIGAFALIATGIFFLAYYFSFKPSPASDEVHGKLSELNSYVVSMMKSPHDLVFLNLGEIGEDDNYLTLMPIRGGVMLDFPAIDGTYSQRQGRYAKRLQDVTKSLALKSDERSNVDNDGNVSGVHFRFNIMGSPEKVTRTIGQVITKTFDVDQYEECSFVYRNLPAGATESVGGGLNRVSGEEFVREFDRGKRVYFGEIKNQIYLIPQKRQAEKILRPDREVWVTNLHELPAGFAAKLRQGTSSKSDRAINQKAELRIVGNSSVGAAHGDGTVHSWFLTGKQIGELNIRLMLAQKGQSHVVKDYRFVGSGMRSSGQIRLRLDDKKLAGNQRTLAATLGVVANQLDLTPGDENNELLPMNVEAPLSSGKTRAVNELPTVAPATTQALFSKAYWKGDKTHPDTIAGMIRASKHGATFLYVTVDWTPIKKAIAK